MLHVIKTKTYFSFSFENKTLNNGLNSFLKVKTTNQHQLFSPLRAFFSFVFKTFFTSKKHKTHQNKWAELRRSDFPIARGNT